MVLKLGLGDRPGVLKGNLCCSFKLVQIYFAEQSHPTGHQFLISHQLHKCS